MRNNKMKQTLSIVLCLCLFLLLISGCSKNSTETDMTSITVNHSESCEEDSANEPSPAIDNTWRETTEDELLTVFGETLHIPEDAENPVLLYLESEQLAELTFSRNGFLWTMRMKPAEIMENISGLNYDWDYESEIKRLSVCIDYMEPESGPSSMRVEKKELLYASNGVYVGVTLWFSKTKGIQYSVAYAGGDYTSFNIASEVIEDLWPWTQE